ncbi:hypothetical protein K431DRAFT_347864 [Polychaeton citri CBS 116435]|uniref:Aminoglycoside phosphotransferase domain-containing protein n=1 Tax=Polychaeton citri CBS 116435 TaxID=1314669 RepID=A0A9P4Q4N7_9PEZI|nr:hypothetical protein K431DRAFT_347864 [Polychaeton citri CBS 116435]
MVESSGTLTGVVDWECVTWVPLWKACDYPTFLHDRTRKMKPDRVKYQCKGSGEPNDLYSEHRMEYELTLPRDEFLDAMRHLQPQWMEIFEESRLQRDFDYAVNNCDNEFLARDIRNRVDTIAGGGIPLGLRDRLQAD